MTSRAPAPAEGPFQGYDAPGSHFSRRLALVHRALADVLSSLPPGPAFVLDVCGGEGRVLLPVLAAHPRRTDLTAAIIELDPTSVARAREHVERLGLTCVEVHHRDAGLSDSYAGLPRAAVVILSGVLVHLAPSARRRLLGFLRQVVAPGAVLVWTAGNRLEPTRLARIRRAVCREVGPLLQRAQVRIGPAGLWVRHEVAASRLEHAVLPLQPGQRVFAMRDPVERRFVPAAMRPLLKRLLARRARTAPVGDRVRR